LIPGIRKNFIIAPQRGEEMRGRRSLCSRAPKNHKPIARQYLVQRYAGRTSIWGPASRWPLRRQDTSSGM